MWIPRLQTTRTDVIRSEPTRKGCGSRCERRPVVSQMISVLSVLSWSLCDHIQLEATSIHSEIRLCSSVRHIDHCNTVVTDLPALTQRVLLLTVRHIDHCNAVVTDLPALTQRVLLLTAVRFVLDLQSCDHVTSLITLAADCRELLHYRLPQNVIARLLACSTCCSCKHRQSSVSRFGG